MILIIDLTIYILVDTNDFIDELIIPFSEIPAVRMP
jgi:hypothetical protein